MEYTKEIKEEYEHLCYLRDLGIITERGKKRIKQIEKSRRAYKKLHMEDVSISFLWNFVNEFTERKVPIKEIKNMLKKYQ